MIYVIIHDDSDEILLAVLTEDSSTSFEKRLRLMSPSSRLLWIKWNHFPTSSITFSFQFGYASSWSRNSW